jgi:hypothetical protein
VIADVQDFFAGLAVHLGELAVAAVIERGTRGTKRLHVHVAMRGGVEHRELVWLWGRGHVWIGDPGKYPGQSSPRRLSKYMSKYLLKDQGDDQGAGGDREFRQHRYLCTQGFKPEVTTRRFEHPAEAEAWLALLIGKEDYCRSFGEEKVDWAFGRFYSYPADVWWPGPSPPE